MTDPNESSEAPLRLRIDTGLTSHFITRDEVAGDSQVVPPSLVYTAITGGTVDMEHAAGPNSEVGRLNNRDLMVLQAFLNNAQTVVNVEMRRRNGHDGPTPW